MTDSDIDLNPQPTPGPWHVGAGLMVCAEDGSAIARCSATRGKFEFEKPNAYVCAAAWEMLEALRRARVYVLDAYECAFPDEAENEAVLAAIDVAIAKATGKAA